MKINWYSKFYKFYRYLTYSRSSYFSNEIFDNIKELYELNPFHWSQVGASGIKITIDQKKMKNFIKKGGMNGKF